MKSSSNKNYFFLFFLFFFELPSSLTSILRVSLTSSFSSTLEWSTSIKAIIRVYSLPNFIPNLSLSLSTVVGVGKEEVIPKIFWGYDGFSVDNKTSTATTNADFRKLR